jgi:hypothetical protein
MEGVIDGDTGDFDGDGDNDLDATDDDGVGETADGLADGDTP